VGNSPEVAVRQRRDRSPRSAVAAIDSGVHARGASRDGDRANRPTKDTKSTDAMAKDTKSTDAMAKDESPKK
jgi:hypothetical protein